MFASENELDFFLKVRHLRHVYEVSNDKRHSELLSRIAGNASLVWFDYQSDCKIWVKDIEKIKERRKRAYSFVRFMLRGFNNCYFVTFTLNDDYYCRYVNEPKNFQRFLRDSLLKPFCRAYFANLDFGKKNGRLHAHAIVACDDIDGLILAYGDRGFTNYKKIVRDTDFDVHRLTRYASKLSLHSLKVTACKPFHSRSSGFYDVDDLPF